jgi:hypothetical protein
LSGWSSRSVNVFLKNTSTVFTWNLVVRLGFTFALEHHSFPLRLA